MKLFLPFVLSIILLNANAQTPFKLHITFENPPAQSVTMETFNKGWFQNKTLNLVNNSFETSIAIEQLEFFKISFNPNTFIVVMASPGDNIKINVDLTDIFKTMNVKGSKPTQLLYSMEKENQHLQLKIDSLIQEYNSLPIVSKTEQSTAYYQVRVDSVKELQNTKMLDFINANSSSPACLFFIEKLDINSYFSLYETIAANLKKLYPNNAIVKGFTDKVEVEKQTAIGSTAPNIKLPGIGGDSLSLYPLQGKIVIIDFWASWCGPCRRENPHKVAVYNKYKDKGLAVFSVSMDTNGDNWRKAIIDDNLSWSDHVSELKGWQSVVSRSFGVSSIPANVIIDGHGKILAKNLRGSQLDAFIESHLE